MAPKAAVTGGKQYDEVVVLALLMHLKCGTTTINPILKDMALLDGNRSISGFEHQLRSANQLATKLLAKKNGGTDLSPADLGRPADTLTAAPNTPKKRKGGK